VKRGDGIIAVGVGPVELPAYLDRPQIVTRLRPNRLHLAEFDKWAEPLKDTFSRILTENLSNLLSTVSMAVFPWQGGMSVDYQVMVEVIRLDNNKEGEALLAARWVILEEEDKRLLAARKSVYTAPSGTQDYEAFAAGHSRNIESLSKDIADALQELAGKR
jgi:uncharacterized lipoprotein YmbA